MGSEAQGIAKSRLRYQVIPRTLCFVMNGDDVLLLARQLLVAVCNGRVFGSTPADTSFVPAAVNALAGTACSTMNWLQGQLDAFNNSGDTGENYFGSAAPGSYPDPTFPSGLGCN